MKKPLTVLVLCLLCMNTMISFGQQKINLADELRSDHFEAKNRTILQFGENTNAVEMNAAEYSGLGILKEIGFKTGTIELEILGENKPGKSFIGIAFNIQDEKTYEAVYFRPFNFVATEPARKAHMLQYIYHPEYTWYKLREERTGEFENEIGSPPDPDDWFHAKIIISHKQVSVYVEDNPEAVLLVDRLTGTKSDKVGLWVGNGSSGRFKNLILTED